MSSERNEQLKTFERAIEAYDPDIVIIPSKVTTQDLNSPFEFVDVNNFSISGDRIQIPSSYSNDATLVRNTIRVKVQAILFNRPGTSVRLSELATSVLDIIEEVKKDPFYQANPKALEVIEHVSGATWLFVRPVIESGTDNIDINKARETYEYAQAREMLLRNDRLQ